MAPASGVSYISNISSSFWVVASVCWCVSFSWLESENAGRHGRRIMGLQGDKVLPTFVSMVVAPSAWPCVVIINVIRIYLSRNYSSDSRVTYWINLQWISKSHCPKIFQALPHIPLTSFWRPIWKPGSHLYIRELSPLHFSKQRVAFAKAFPYKGGA